MAISFARLVTIAYLSLNGLITLIVSILGVIYVRKAATIRKEMTKQIEPKAITINTEDKTTETNKQKDSNEVTQNEDNEIQHIKEVTKMGFVKLWLKLVWKMRSCYMCLIVHAFDVLTDIIVIIEWWSLEKKEHINPRLMAWCGIIVLLFHQFISTLAFWIKDKSAYRAILQLFDVLIFEEMYISHKKIIAQFRNHKTAKAAIETTTSFKYIRSLEAVFESIPQSVLQMVFLIRTGADYGGDITLLVISFISIFQSIVSMTNSIIKQDNLYMDFPRFKPHRQRLPPTLPFLKHAICRLSEVFNRIALMSLFWAVCGGKAFTILLGIELLFIFGLTAIERAFGEWGDNPEDYGIQELNADDMFLRVQGLVVLPSEMIFAAEGSNWFVNCGFELYEDGLRWDSFQKDRAWNRGAVPFACCATICCCYFPSVLISTLCYFRKGFHYHHPNFRIGTSLIEWIILICVAVSSDDGVYAFSPEYGLWIFVVGLVLFLIYTQYLCLLPNFVLPHGVRVRSKWGYSFNGELEELIRMKAPNDAFDEGIADIYDKKRKQEGTTPAMFALSNGHYDIVQWLENEKEAKLHKELFEKQQKFKSMDETFARQYIDRDETYFAKSN